MIKPIGSHYLERLPATTTQPAREVLYVVIGHQKTRLGHQLGTSSVLAKVAEIKFPGERFVYRGYWPKPSEVETFMERVEKAQ